MVAAVCYLLHAGEPLLTLQSAGRWDLQAAEGVQGQCVQEQVLRWAFQPNRGPLLFQHGFGVRVRAHGRGLDRGGRAGGARRARRPGGVAGTVLRRKYTPGG